MHEEVSTIVTKKSTGTNHHHQSGSLRKLAELSGISVKANKNFEVLT